MKQTALFLLLLVCIPLSANDTVTLDLNSILSAFPQDEYGKWTETYSANKPVTQGIFRFSHTGSSDGGGGMTYWEGFTLCTSGDKTDHGNGNSDGWIAHQWGCMAGGGLDEHFMTKEGRPYLVAYWGYMQEASDDSYHSLRIDFTDGELHKAAGVYICNHPWPYYGNIHGDGFAAAFQNEGDCFSVTAHGLDEDGEPTGISTSLTLAEFKAGTLHQSDQWQYMDLTALGSVSGIYFTMHTTDESELYGANTAVFFCLDKLRVLTTDDEPQQLLRPTGLKVEETGEDTMKLSWNKVQNATQYHLLLNGEPYQTTADTFCIFRQLKADTEYTLAVYASDGNTQSETAATTAKTKDLTPPSAPTGLTAQADDYSISVSWNPADDNVAVTKYTVFLDGSPYRHTAATNLVITGLEPATDYVVEISAQDAAGNVSDKASVSVRTTGGNALPSVEEAPEQECFFSISGMYIGKQTPRNKGVYIIRCENKNTAVILKTH